jgi:all-trans-retinol 13,14-reductase
LVTAHFLHGAAYPVGGAQQIAHGLLQTVADAGGWTRICADVAEILVERGRAVGVRLTDGEIIRARRVISAAGLVATASRLLPLAVREQRWARELSRLEPTPAHVGLYLGFEGDIRSAGARATNQWFYNGWNVGHEGWAISSSGPLPDPPAVYCSFPSLKDPEHAPGPEQLHTAALVAFAPWEAFRPWLGTARHRRGADYQQLKERLQDKLLEQLFQRLPALRPMVRHVELSTPLSTDLYCRPVRGAAYGTLPTIERFTNRWLRARSPLPGLFFAGSEVAVCGVVGAMMGGVMAVTSAEPVGAFRHLTPIFRDRPGDGASVSMTDDPPAG